MALKHLVGDFQNAGRRKKDKKNMVEVRSFWLAGPVCKVGCRTPPPGAALYVAVQTFDFGVRVKMWGER